VLGATATPVGVACSETPLAVSPVRAENIKSLAPVGTLVPPDHVFPTPHMYFYVKNDLTPGEIETPVFAPADLVVTSITLRNYGVLRSKTNYTDYSLVFRVCDGLEMYFHHVRTLTHSALSQVLQQQTCTPQGGGNEQACNISVYVPIAAGTQVGTTGDTVAGVGGLDMGARDYRLVTGRLAFARPDRWCGATGFRNIFDRCHTVCPLDYLPAAEQEKLLGRFSDFTGTILRTEDPRCGTVYRDVAGTAQGHWFAVGKFTHVMNEAPHLFLGPSGLTSNVQELSVGTSLTGVRGGGYKFHQQEGGQVNRRFTEIVDNQVYCYETLFRDARTAEQHTNPVAGVTVLLRLAPGGSNVTLEGRAADSCGSGPWSLGSHAVEFER
jgi:hypothetical protein